MSLRPQSMDGFIGQEHIKKLIKTAIRASKIRNEPLDHILLTGPSGVGKTTLAFIIANELGTSAHTLNAAGIENLDDVRRIIASMKKGDILFIDEIHRLPIKIEEFLYHPMEDGVIEVEKEFASYSPVRLAVMEMLEKKIEESNDELALYCWKRASQGTVREKAMKLKDIPPITFIGATTKAGGLTKPLRDRFTLPIALQQYNENELDLIVKQKADMLDVAITDRASRSIAKRGRGTARVVVNYVKRCRDTATVLGYPLITPEIVNNTLSMLGVNSIGLTKIDLVYLKLLTRDDKPRGLRAISLSINEDPTTVEEVIEPYLMQLEFIERTPRGRVITAKGMKYINCIGDA